MSTALSVPSVSLAVASPEMKDRVAEAEAKMLEMPQIEVQTIHMLHGGMYSRTVKLAAGVAIIGVTIKVPTQLIISGDCKVLAGDEWLELSGFNVIPGQAGRKGVFVTASETYITMIFPSQAKTVAEAEAEFTAEGEQLLSHRQDGNDIVIITGS